MTNLADLTGIHRNTSRNPGSERAQAKLREIVRVTLAAASLTDDPSKVIDRCRNERIAGYDHKTAAEPVAEEQVEAVMSYLGDLKTERLDENRPPGLDKIFRRYLTPKWPCSVERRWRRS